MTTSAANIALLLVGAGAAFVFFNPRLLKSRIWRATVTPLASIIGSGFLVAGPILGHTAGTSAWLAMAGLCLMGYLFGAAIRHNIVHVQPGLGHGANPTARVLERLSNLTLALSYFISVAYYLTLFSAFGLRFVDMTNPAVIRIAATAVIAAAGLIGGFGGLRAMERVEVFTVGFKFCVIAGVIAALAVAMTNAIAGGSLLWRDTADAHGFNELRMILGLVILVQGFETSRYLGAEYDAAERVRTMKYAQWISSGVYMVFILLVTPHFAHGLPEQGGETAIIDMLRPVASIIAPALILAALASQLSAAAADMNGSGGLLAEAAKTKLDVRFGNVITAVAAIAVIWVADIYEIIVWASKTFVAYYGLQALQAALSSWRMKRHAEAAMYALLVALAATIVAIAIPTGG
ncbi:MAG: hypothetical protein R3C52_08645 [Hyphomonadaceae bacterium]